MQRVIRISTEFRLCMRWVSSASNINRGVARWVFASPWLIRLCFTKASINSFIGGLKAVRIRSEKLGFAFDVFAEIGLFLLKLLKLHLRLLWQRVAAPNLLLVGVSPKSVPCHCVRVSVRAKYSYRGIREYAYTRVGSDNGCRLGEKIFRRNATYSRVRSWLIA